MTAARDSLLQDTNGDGVADRREVLVRGLTAGNQQLQAMGFAGDWMGGSLLPAVTTGVADSGIIWRLPLARFW